jgi:HlyD family secretion protein
VTTWSAPDALTVPVSALFRKGDQWTVFAHENGRARSTSVQIGHRNNRSVEVIAGLAAGDRIVLPPSDRIADGSRFASRIQQQARAIRQDCSYSCGITKGLRNCGGD